MDLIPSFYRLSTLVASAGFFYLFFLSHLSLSLYLFIYLFIYLTYLFLAALGLHCRGLSCCGAQAPDTQAQ